MSFNTAIAAITITCYKRLAPYLAQEVRDLGYEVDEIFSTGIRMRGSLNDCIRLNLNLRCASHVLYSIKQFNAANADDIYRNVNRCDWEELLPDPGYFSVTSNVLNDTIQNTMFANLRVKDAIVDRVRAKRGTRPSTGAELSGAVVHLFWKEEDAEIFLDTSGISLARHGYRKIPGRAPMLEALAAATIMASRWDRVSPFVNPMCGSGTLAIEAALIATNTRPGLFRDNYAFMHLAGYDEAFYLDERGRLESQIIELPDLKILATDHSNVAIESTRKNAVAAGVADMITLEVCDFTKTKIPENSNGVVFFNPEYGERLGELEELENTYSAIGDFMKKECGGYFGYIFTGNLDLAKKVGLKAKRRIEFYTATIDSRLFEYELYTGTRDHRKIDQQI
jgi:putative N6-adenine-specific DNA methylase